MQGTTEEGKARRAESEEFARQAELGQTTTVGELWYFLQHEKKWWLAPIIGVLLVVAVLIVLGNTAAAPLIYALF